jgi:trehalose/maltose hydrolase-like predicted phosphorylase
MECSLKKFASIPLGTHVSGMTFVQAASKEQIPWKVGNNNCEILLSKSEQGFDEIYELANITIRSDLNVA